MSLNPEKILAWMVPALLTGAVHSYVTLRDTQDELREKVVAMSVKLQSHDDALNQLTWMRRHWPWKPGGREEVPQDLGQGQQR